jgi:hypothetical protein
VLPNALPLPPKLLLSPHFPTRCHCQRSHASAKLPPLPPSWPAFFATAKLPQPRCRCLHLMMDLVPFLFACCFSSHRKESHTKTEGIKLLVYALHIFLRVKIA